MFWKIFLHCRVRTKKLLDTKVKLKKKNLGKNFLELKTGFFRASFFGFRVKGVCPLLLPLVSLVIIIFNSQIKVYLKNFIIILILSCKCDLKKYFTSIFYITTFVVQYNVCVWQLDNHFTFANKRQKKVIPEIYVFCLWI